MRIDSGIMQTDRGWIPWAASGVRRDEEGPYVLEATAENIRQNLVERLRVVTYYRSIRETMSVGACVFGLACAAFTDGPRAPIIAIALMMPALSLWDRWLDRVASRR